METMKDIRAHFASAKEGEYNALFQHYENDERSGVQKLIQQYRKKLQALENERARTEIMKEYEHKYEHLGYLCGIDEVGRGPLAGPVTVAAVILKPHWFAEGLNDSKKVTPKHREVLAEKIHREAVEVSIVSLPPEEIDALNIYQATMTAMYQAVRNLHVKPDAVIVDAMPLHFPFPTVSMVHGDARSASVAAASIAAKVYRDHLMDAYDKQYPGYGFSQNKGYGTAEHIEALHRLGITPIHRKSFEPVKTMLYEGW